MKGIGITFMEVVWNLGFSGEDLEISEAFNL